MSDDNLLVNNMDFELPVIEKEWVQAHLETGEIYYWHVTSGGVVL